MLINEQRNLFKSDDFTKETCHFNMRYLKENVIHQYIEIKHA